MQIKISLEGIYRSDQLVFVTALGGWDFGAQQPLAVTTRSGSLERCVMTLPSIRPHAVRADRLQEFALRSQGKP